MNAKFKSYLNLIIKILISVSLVSYLLYTQDLEAIKNSLKEFNYIYLVVALGLLLFGTWISSLRWQKILQTSNYEVSTKFLYSLYIKGYLYNNFLPTQMGGDVYKAVFLGRNIKDQSTAFFSVFMDRFSGLIVLLALSLIGLFIDIKKGDSSLLIKLTDAANLPAPSQSFLYIVLLAAIIGLALYLPILRLIDKIIGHKIKFINKFLKASELIFKDKPRGALIIAYSLLIQAISFSTAYVVFLGLDVRLRLEDVITYMPIISLASLIPSFNGFGTQDTVYALLFSNAGVTEAVAVTASIIMHIVRLTMSLFGGVLVLFGF